MKVPRPRLGRSGTPSGFDGRTYHSHIETLQKICWVLKINDPTWIKHVNQEISLRRADAISRGVGITTHVYAARRDCGGTSKVAATSTSPPA